MESPLLKMGFFDKIAGEAGKKLLKWGEKNPKKFTGLMYGTALGVGVSCATNGWDTLIDITLLNEAKSNLDYSERQMKADRDLPNFEKSYANFSKYNKLVCDIEKKEMVSLSIWT